MSKITAADHDALRDAVLAGDSWRAIGRQFGVHHNAAKKAWEQIAAERGAGWAAGNDPKAAAIEAIGTDIDPAVAYMAARQGVSAERMAELLTDPTERDDEVGMHDRSSDPDYSEREQDDFKPVRGTWKSLGNPSGFYYWGHGKAANDADGRPVGIVETDPQGITLKDADGKFIARFGTATKFWATVMESAPTEAPEPTSKLVWFPEGVCSPTEFRNLIVAERIVPDSFRRQQVYSWIASSKRNPFPVKHYASASDVRGEASDFTRPGVQVDDAREWVKAWVAAKAAN